MSPCLLDPRDAAEALARRVGTSWAARVCTEVEGTSQSPLTISLRPGVTGQAAVEQVGLAAWTAWRLAWRRLDLSDLDGALVTATRIRIRGVTETVPRTLEIRDLEAATAVLGRLGGPDLPVDLARARSAAVRLREAGGRLTPRALRALCRLTDADVDVAVQAVSWIRDHPTLDAWTARQIPIPGMDSKWWERHPGLIGALVGRDLPEPRPRLSVVHLTYVDPSYLADPQARRHDSWTTGDRHDLAYAPRAVLIVENRDSRLWFPPVPGTIVVEGGGKAAARTLVPIEWLMGAEHLVYWGDLDADGLAILDHLRAALYERGRRLDSILMDGAAYERYQELGVSRGADGALLEPSHRRLAHLTDAEARAHARLTTDGPSPVRRIEQEKIPPEDAAAALVQLIGAR